MQKSAVLYILFLLTASGLSAQTATGSWFGKAEVDLTGMHNNYLTELVIKQKGSRVDGVFGYYFRDKYQSFYVHGHYNPRTREVTILNIPLTYYGSNSTINSIDCNTNFRAVLINSRLKSSLKGYFYHDERYKHMCPDLKVEYTLDRNEDKQDSVEPTANARIWQPQSDDIVVDVSKKKAADSLKKNLDSFLTAAMQKTDSVYVQPAADSANAMASAGALPANIPTAADTAEMLTRADDQKIAQSFSQRKPTLNKELLVESDSIRVSFYDNGIIDGDSISVFLNHQLVLKHQELAAKALVVYLRLDSALETNEVSMFAENLGKYPPNTALMVVTDGKNRYEVFMSSSLKENATIQLKRKKAL